MSRQGNPWAMSPSPTSATSSTVKGPIKKESWRPAAQSSWQPDKGKEPAKPEPERRNFKTGAANRFNRLDNRDEDRSWAAWNRRDKGSYRDDRRYEASTYRPRLPRKDRRASPDYGVGSREDRGRSRSRSVDPPNKRPRARSPSSSRSPSPLRYSSSPSPPRKRNPSPPRVPKGDPPRPRSPRTDRRERSPIPPPRVPRARSPSPPRTRDIPPPRVPRIRSPSPGRDIPPPRVPKVRSASPSRRPDIPPPRIPKVRSPSPSRSRDIPPPRVPKVRSPSPSRRPDIPPPRVAKVRSPSPPRPRSPRIPPPRERSPPRIPKRDSPPRNLRNLDRQARHYSPPKSPPRQVSPRRPLPDQREIFSGPRQSWAARRDRWAEGVARGRDVQPPAEKPPSPPSSDTLAAHQRSYSDHLNSIAPYVQAAFKQWLEQNTSPALPNFLVHYFGRPPTTEEVEQIQQLLERKRRLTEDERELGVLAEQGKELRPPVKRLPPGEVYERLACVGEGTYGKVYKARNGEDGSLVAMKRIRMEGEKDGFPVTAMREIKLLQGLKHPNVIRLVEMMVSKGSVFMIFEYMEHDLTGLLAHPDLKFSPGNIKSLNYQMLDSLAYLHDRSILHRDLKGSNILLDGKGVLKLADFGLARFYSKRKRDDYTNRVITLWYRSPELLLGETVYGPEVDIWSAGCIMLEIFITKPVFQGNDEIHQLDTIYAVMGTPSETTWPGLGELPWYELVRPKSSLPNKFRESFKKWLSPSALDLAERVLAYDPAKRISARDAMRAEYFMEEPRMEMPGQLVGYGEQHEMDAKASRRKKRTEEAR